MPALGNARLARRDDYTRLARQLFAGTTFHQQRDEVPHPAVLERRMCLLHDRGYQIRCEVPKPLDKAFTYFVYQRALAAAHRHSMLKNNLSVNTDGWHQSTSRAGSVDPSRVHLPEWGVRAAVDQQRLNDPESFQHRLHVLGEVRVAREHLLKRLQAHVDLVRKQSCRRE
jgi:hypothetical protein